MRTTILLCCEKCVCVTCCFDGSCAQVESFCANKNVLCKDLLTVFCCFMKWLSKLSMLFCGLDWTYEWYENIYRCATIKLVFMARSLVSAKGNSKSDKVLAMSFIIIEFCWFCWIKTLNSSLIRLTVIMKVAVRSMGVWRVCFDDFCAQLESFYVVKNVLCKDLLTVFVV